VIPAATDSTFDTAPCHTAEAALPKRNMPWPAPAQSMDCWKQRQHASSSELTKQVDFLLKETSNRLMNQFVGMFLIQFLTYTNPSGRL